MSQLPVEYDTPKIVEKVNHNFDGVLTRIVAREFSKYSESIPGSTAYRCEMNTRLLIRMDESELTLDLNGFVDSELVGQEVKYVDITKVTTTLFNPKGRENDTSYRRGVRITERTYKLIPLNLNISCYIFKETSQDSL